MNQKELKHIRTLKNLKALYRIEKKNPYIYTREDEITISVTGVLNFLLQRGDISMSEYIDIIK